MQLSIVKFIDSNRKLAFYNRDCVAIRKIFTRTRLRAILILYFRMLQRKIRHYYSLRGSITLEYTRENTRIRSSSALN